MPDTLIIWAIVLGASAALLFVLEIAIPSGGLLGILSFGSLTGMIAVLFMIDSNLGFAGIIGSVFIVPAALVLAFKLFPHTVVGRRLILSDAQKAGETRYSSTGIDSTEGLLGQQGVTVTPMYPGGEVKINGRRINCTAAHGTIEKGINVEVVNVNGLEIEVRPVTA